MVAPEQTTILVATLCPEAPDAAACEAGLTEYWSQIGKPLVEGGAKAPPPLYLKKLVEKWRKWGEKRKIDKAVTVLLYSIINIGFKDSKSQCQIFFFQMNI